MSRFENPNEKAKNQSAVAGILGNSIILISDSGAMLVASFCFAVSIYMEKQKVQYGSKASETMEARIALLSVFLLILVTTISVSVSINRLLNFHVFNELDVSGPLVLGFSLCNVLADVIMCGNFFHRVGKGVRNEGELNVRGAFAHLLADTLRALTGVVAGSVMISLNENTVYIDAYTTFAVCFVIFAAASVIFFEAIMQLKRSRSLQTVGLGGGERGAV